MAEIRPYIHLYHWIFKLPLFKLKTFENFIAITIYNHILFKYDVMQRVLDHELVHMEQQQREVCPTMFYIKYGLEFLKNYFFKYPFQWKKSYYNVSYEIEAYNRMH